MLELLNKLKKNYPDVRFKSGKNFMWSSQEKTIYYDSSKLKTNRGCWSLLHELGHAQLNHTVFKDDLELLKLELDAWKLAKELAADLDITIDDSHIDSCLDSYRDWLKNRSTCPDCGVTNTHDMGFSYSCFNCGGSWHVSPSQLCSKTRPTKKLATA